MKIFLNEITDQEKELQFSQDDSWVLQSVLRADESFDESFNREQFRPIKKRPIQVSLSLRKVDEVIVISGQIHTFIELVCSRCANSFQYLCHPHFSALFCNDPVMAGVGHLQRSGHNHEEEGRPAGQNQGFARHAHNFEHDQDIAEGKDLDITYLSHDFIELGDVLTEQIQIQIPFQPLCKEACKGICAQCGTDLNQGRCACAKIVQHSPFSVLRDFKA